MNREQYITHLSATLEDAVEEARQLEGGQVANYIPELANVDTSMLSTSLILADGTQISAGDAQEHAFTLQSVAKLIVLIGLMEEYGEHKIFSWIHPEPTGQSFASLPQIDRYDPVPANPMVNLR